MKRNALLFLALAFLFGAAYWFEELGELRRYRQLRIFPKQGWSNLVELEGLAVKLVRVENQWQTGQGAPVQEKKLRDFFSILSSLVIDQVLPASQVSAKNRRFYFPPDSPWLRLNFSGRTVRILLGRQLNFDQGFYLEVKEPSGTRRLVARDESPQPGVYDPRIVHRSSAKYLRLKALLELADKDFGP